MVGMRNLSLLTDIYGTPNVTVIGLDYKSKRSKLVNLLRLKPMGYSKGVLRAILDCIAGKNITLVYLDNSLFGGLARMIKTQYPEIKIITFFHNIEYLYFRHKMRIQGYHNLLMLLMAKVNERQATSYSDYVFCLNQRDQQHMQQIYGRKAELIVPIGLKDTFDPLVPKINSSSTLPIALFVGSDNFANMEGITWFLDQVAARLNCQLWIVGKGLDKLKKKYAETERLRIFGLVDELAGYYNAAHLFINPVFSGSGMKTKTVEAMMFGKYIFGTNEAFEGFLLDYRQTGGLCNTAEEFISAINQFLREQHSLFNEYTRQLFLSQYENKSISTQLLNFLAHEGLVSDSTICL